MGGYLPRSSEREFDGGNVSLKIVWIVKLLLGWWVKALVAMFIFDEALVVLPLMLLQYLQKEDMMAESRSRKKRRNFTNVANKTNSHSTCSRPSMRMKKKMKKRTNPNTEEYEMVMKNNKRKPKQTQLQLHLQQNNNTNNPSQYMTYNPFTFQLVSLVLWLACSI